MCENRWNTLRSRVMGYEEDKKVACSVRREAQQGLKYWGYGEVDHHLWTCPKKAAHPEKGEVQPREVRRVEEEKVQRKWHQRKKTVEWIGQL